jgi:glutamyl-tRNA reductase
MTTNPAREEPADRRVDARQHRDPRAVRSAIRSRGEAIRQHELDRALRRFRAAGECSPEQAAILEAMARDIVEGVLSTPAGVLESAPPEDRALQTTIELFDPAE